MSNYWINLSRRIKQSDKLRFNYLQSKIVALEERCKVLEDRLGYTVTVTETNSVTGATVKLGTTSFTDNNDGTYTLNDVTPNTYTLTASKNGYTSISESVTVDGVENITITLEEAEE